MLLGTSANLHCKLPLIVDLLPQRHINSSPSPVKHLCTNDYVLHLDPSCLVRLEQRHLTTTEFHCVLVTMSCQVFFPLMYLIVSPP